MCDSLEETLGQSFNKSWFCWEVHHEPIWGAL